jgi:hypothetical protein
LLHPLCGTSVLTLSLLILITIDGEILRMRED